MAEVTWTTQKLTEKGNSHEIVSDDSVRLIRWNDEIWKTGNNKQRLWFLRHGLGEGPSWKGI